MLTRSFLKVSAKMASGHSRRSTRRSLVMGERMGPPKLFETKRESVISTRPAQFGKSGPSGLSARLPSFGAQPKRSSTISTNQSARGYVVYVWMFNNTCAPKGQVFVPDLQWRKTRALSTTNVINNYDIIYANNMMFMFAAFQSRSVKRLVSVSNI